MTYDTTFGHDINLNPGRVTPCVRVLFIVDRIRWPFIRPQVFLALQNATNAKAWPIVEAFNVE